MSEFSDAYREFVEADLLYWKVLTEELGLESALDFIHTIAAHTMLSATLRNDYRIAYNKMIEKYNASREN